MAETVHDLARRAMPVSDVLSDTGETAQRFGEVYQTAATVPDKPMLGQEQQERISGWRGLPRRAIRALHRCRAMFRMPEELSQLNRTVNVELAGVEHRLPNLIGEHLSTLSAALRIELSGIHEQLRYHTENQAALRPELSDIREQLRCHIENQAALHTELSGIHEQLRYHAENQARLVPEAFSELQRELSTEMAFSLHDVAQRLVGQHDGTQTEQHSGGQAIKLESIGNHLNRLANEQFESKNQLIHVGTNTESLLRNLTTIAVEILNAAIHLGTSLHDIAQRLIGQRSGTRIEQQLDEQARKIESIGNRLANEQFEAKNQLIHVGTNTESLLQNLTTIAVEIQNAAIHLGTSLQTRLNTIEYERLDGLYDQMHHVTAALLHLRVDVKKDRTERSRLPAERYEPAQPRVLEADLRRAQAEFPQVFPMWAERLEEMRKACLETKTGNVARAGDPRSEAFGSLVELHAVGRVLDVGCGIFGRPFYLSSYPASLISGLDPLKPREPVDFEFVRGIQEYLPWSDGAFSTVISATALDHCLSLDRSVAEIRRVLCAGGKFLLWIDSQPGSSRFSPDAPDFLPADRFHLFHFDVAWLEPMLDRWFELIDKVELKGREFDRVMYCLRLRNSDSAKQVVNPVY